MPTLNTAELNQLLNEESAARIEARTLANIARRASTLFSDGYSASALGHGLYTVFSPKGDICAVRVSNDPAPFGSSCSCLCFEARQTCKHLQALVLAIEEGAEGDALQDTDDDKYPEF